MFILLDKLADRSHGLAAKTVECLLIRTDIKRGRLFLMKGTESAKFSAGPSKREITANYVNNIECGRNLFNRLWRDARHSLNVHRPRRIDRQRCRSPMRRAPGTEEGTPTAH